MHRTLSFRRHQDWKHKEEAKRRMHQWSWRYTDDPAVIGMWATTPCPCSCMGCGNDRVLEGDTLQEKRSLEETLDIIEEMCYNRSIIK